VSDTGILIGELSRLSGVTAETIRYYERERILPKPRRMGSGKYRRYEVRDAERLRFVRRARDLGFSLDDIRILLDLAASDRGRPCGSVDDLCRTHIRNIDEKLAQLATLRKELHRLTSECNPGGTIRDCALLSALSGE
jgi:DNA-binding transcriptional MerR regulator